MQFSKLEENVENIKLRKLKKVESIGIFCHISLVGTYRRMENLLEVYISECIFIILEKIYLCKKKLLVNFWMLAPITVDFT